MNLIYSGMRSDIDHSAHLFGFIGGVIFSFLFGVINYFIFLRMMEYGGLFVDLATNPPYPVVPKFNSIAMFKVPRLHQVTPIEDGVTKARYSLFGWTLKPCSDNPKKVRIFL
jgi:hypothetical protein